MAPMIDLRELERELVQTKANLDAWAKQRTEFAAYARDAHREAVHDQTMKLQSLQTRHASLGAAVKEVKQRVEREEQEASSLQRTVSAGQQEQEHLQKKVAAFREQLAAQESECVALEEGAELEEGIKLKKLDALRKALALYSTRLGLDFKQGTDELHLLFTQIDAAAPTRLFSIGVKVHENQKYEVTSCVPPVDALAGLVEKLNLSNDFSAFVKAVRAEFVKAAARA